MYFTVNGAGNEPCLDIALLKIIKMMLVSKRLALPSRVRKKFKIGFQGLELSAEARIKK